LHLIAESIGVNARGTLHVGFAWPRLHKRIQFYLTRLFRQEGNEAETKTYNKKSRGNLHNHRVLCSSDCLRIQLCY
jgi:hypothetical protein